jgi:hypothetical protein
MRRCEKQPAEGRVNGDYQRDDPYELRTTPGRFHG